MNPLLLALTIFAFLPLLGALPRHWPLGAAWVDGASLLFAGLALAWTWFNSSKKAIVASPVLHILLGLLAAMLASVLLNSFGQTSAWLWYVVYVLFALAFVLAVSEWYSQLGRQRFVQGLLDAVYWAVLAYAGLSLVFYYLAIPESSASLPRLYGLWAQPNLTSTMVWLGVLAASLRFSLREQFTPFLLSLLLFAWVLACAASRISWLIAAALLFLAALSYLPRWRSASFLVYRHGMIAAVLLVVVALFAVPPVNDALRDSLGFDNSALSLSQRDVAPDSGRVYELKKLQQAMSDMSVKQWLVGVGPGQYSQFSSPKDYDLPIAVIKDQTWTHSHNIFTMVLVEMGLLGLFVLLVLFVLVLRRMMLMPLDKEQVFIVGALAIVFVHSNLEYPLWYAWYFLLLCALLVPLFGVKEVQRSKQALAKPKLAIAVLVLCLALSAHVFSQFWRIIDAKSASVSDIQAYSSLLFMADSPWLGSYATLLRYRKFAPATAALDEQLQEVERMKAWQPRDMVLMREYSLYLLQADYAKACDIAQRNAFRFPRSGPLMLEHIELLGRVPMVERKRIESCVVNGLAERGETLESMRLKNQRALGEEFY